MKSSSMFIAVDVSRFRIHIPAKDEKAEKAGKNRKILLWSIPIPLKPLMLKKLQQTG